MAGVLNDLVVTIQGIRLYLASPYGPPPPLHPAASAGQQALPWYSVPAATTGGFDAALAAVADAVRGANRAARHYPGTAVADLGPAACAVPHRAIPPGGNGVGSTTAPTQP